MATVLSIIASILVLGLAIFFAVRKRRQALPPSAESTRAEAAPKLPHAVPAPSAEPSSVPAAHEPILPQTTAPRAHEVASPAVSSALELRGQAKAEAHEGPADQDSQRELLPDVVATTPSIPAGATPSEQAVAAMKKGLAGTRGGFIAKLAKLFTGKNEIDKGLLEEIEETLISADLGIRTTDRILADLRAKMQAGELRDEQSVWSCIRRQAESILDVPSRPMALQGKPAIILIIGVNGVGKTTTIGKLASRYVAEGKKVLLAAGDTYRAAAVLQLEMWGKRVGCAVVKGKENADPGSVIFEAIKRARDEGHDLVIADTAGRLHTKAPLMDELKKVERTIAKATDGGCADEVFMVLDATTGQNAVQQMKVFREAIGVTGVVLTKLDGTAKGGVVLGIVDQHQIPIRFIGLGERVEDLREFDPHMFVEALFAKPNEATLAA